jgi:hypothetical protein
MADNEYHFITHWRVPGTVEAIAEILSDAPGLVRWWPSVYLDVKQLEPGDARGVGKVVDLYTKGWLPYTLRWQFQVTEVKEDGFTLVASGDFVGRGIWTFVQDGPDVLIEYDWKILAEKPLLRTLSFIMKPIFEANHRWAMARGEESLKLELARRHAGSEAERALIPAPPAGTRAPVGALVVGLLGAAAVVWIVTRRTRARARE